MIKNICKQKECKLYDPDFPNNCRVMREIKTCRILEKMGVFKIKKRANVPKHNQYGWIGA